jgi:hypothetical protein
MEIFVSLKGMQISVINNVNLEIATITIRDSLPSWILTNTNQRGYFTQQYSCQLERKYLEYLYEKKFIKNLIIESQLELLTTNTPNESDKFDINFDKMTMIKPEEGN